MQNAEEKNLRQEISNEGYSWYRWLIINILLFISQHGNEIKIIDQLLNTKKI